jgi:cellulose synthase/poly-beta-1,6-N-acetylglucosamine synthase-like glycosyltransferase
MVLDLRIPSLVAIIVIYVYWFYWFFLTSVYLFKREKVDNQKVQVEDPPHFVSIVIPASNEEKVISTVIQDCLKQTHQNLEVVLVAHNCKDKTVEKASLIKDSRLRVFPLNTDKWGKGIALNYGIEQCRGDVIFIFDSDARFVPDFVERMLNRLEQGYDAVQTKIVGKNPNYNLLTFLAHMESLLFMSVFCGAKDKLKMNAIIGGTGACFKTKALEAVGYFRNVLSEDLDMYLKLTRAGYKIGYADKCFVYDEKPTTLKSFFRQRSRWLAGHRAIMMEQTLREDFRMMRRDPLNFVFLFSPLFLIIFCFSLTLPILALVLSVFSINVIFLYGLPIVWFFSLAIMYAYYIMVFRRQFPFYDKRILKLFPIFLIYMFYGYVAIWISFGVKSWEHTKTEHGSVDRNFVVK